MRALILVMVMTLLLPFGSPRAQQEQPVRVATPAYTADFDAGSLVLRDASGAVLLNENAPQLCVGAPHLDPDDVMPNGSVEALNPSGAPEGWTIYRPYIKVTQNQASAGSNALAWQLDTPDDPNGRGVDTPAAPVQGGEQYTIEFDWTAHKAAGEAVFVYLAWYADAAGQGQRNAELVRRLLSDVPAGSSGNGHEVLPVSVPTQARSARILFRAAGDLTGTVALDNLTLRHISCPRPSVVPTVSMRQLGDQTEVVSDLAWPDVRIRRVWLLSSSSPVIRLRTEFTYLTPTYVTSERLQFVAPTSTAQTIGRDFRPVALTDSTGYLGDPLSPRVLDIPGVLLMRADGAQSTVAWSDGANATFSMYADHSANHPLGLYVRNQAGRKTDVSQTYRQADETSTLEAQIVVGNHAQPLTVLRQPHGFEATLALSEHADNANLPASAAVNYGTSDTSDPEYGRKGFVGNGLRYTKSAFGFPSAGDPAETLQSQAYLAHLSELARTGIEIIPHTVSAVTDDRTVTRSGLDQFAPFRARNWIDHGHGDGASNLEALTSQGLLPDSQFRIIDLLRDFGYTYAWSDIDYPIEQGTINLLRVDRPWEPRALAFSVHRNDGALAVPPNFAFWSTAIPTLSPETFVTPENVRRLVSERGVYVSHDYFPRPRYEGHLFQTRDGVVAITDSFESSLRTIGAAQRTGELWVPTISEMLDFWTGLYSVRIVELGGGEYSITNTGQREVSGVTLSTGSEAISATVNGQNAAVDAQKLRLPVLPAGGELRVTIQNRS